MPSRADFWALFAILVLKQASTDAGESFQPSALDTFQYGRKQTTNCQAGQGRLPGAEGGLEQLALTFVKRMGLTLEDGITLLGAHR